MQKSRCILKLTDAEKVFFLLRRDTDGRKWQGEKTWGGDNERRLKIFFGDLRSFDWRPNAERVSQKQKRRKEKERERKSPSFRRSVDKPKKKKRKRPNKARARPALQHNDYI